MMLLQHRLKQKTDQRKQKLQKQITEDVQKELVSDVVKKGKSIIGDEEEEELSDFSDNDLSRNDEDPEEAVKKILEEMRKSKENT